MHWKGLVATVCLTLVCLAGPATAAQAQDSDSPYGVQYRAIEEQEESRKQSSFQDMERRTLQRSYNTSSMRYDNPEKDVDEEPVDYSQDISTLPVFGQNLFSGNFQATYYDEINPQYKLQSGDHIEVHIWGALTFDGELVVDSQGNVFIPTIGPIHVAGVRNADLDHTFRRAIESVYSSNYDAYINLMTPQPVAVFVTGFTSRPGRYAGGGTETALYFLDAAGGIDPERGSYRSVRIMRRGDLVGEVDLYDFILSGNLGFTQLREGDTIVVARRGIRVAAFGDVRHQAWFEFLKPAIPGRQLMYYADPEPGVTHVSIQGYREGQPFLNYLTVADFENFMLHENDRVQFISDVPAESITILAEGALNGSSRFMVRKGAKLLDVLNYIAVDPAYANLDGIHLLRKSVAERQKQALHEALHRLEQNAYTASSDSVDEANIRVKEAQLISDFVARAKLAEPQGIIVVNTGDSIKDIILEDQDVVVIPPKSDIVLVSGEVIAPNAIAFQDGFSAKDYINEAGGFTEKADKRRILLAKPAGQLMLASKGVIEPGDHIMVLPAYEGKGLQFVKDITQILFQLALTTKAVFTPW